MKLPVREANIALVVIVAILLLQIFFDANRSITAMATASIVDPGSLERVLVKPFKQSDAIALKSLGAVQHEFSDGTFSLIASSHSINMIRGYAEVGRIPVLEIQSPVSNTSVPNVFVGNPGRFSKRVCSPSAQIPWGISKVTNNKIGGGAGIVIAVLDTGVSNHPDLNPKVCVSTVEGGVRKGCGDKNGHGTHVAGIATANGGYDKSGIYGVAPEAALMAIRVCKPDGRCWADDIARGIYYAVDNGANIITMSFGSGAESAIIRDAIVYGASRGVLFVAAAGNDGPLDGSIDYPAANVNVIAAAATDSSDTIASWSSRGINYHTTPWVVEERDMEFGAPGVSIESTWNDGCYRVLSGTSMAAPHIAGLAAKVWQGSGPATRDFLRYRARYFYSDIGRLEDDPDAGFGLPTAPVE